MACSVEILRIEVLSTDNGQFATLLRVQGRAEECENIDVTVECAKRSVSGVATVGASNVGADAWEVELPADDTHMCLCGGTVRVFASCAEAPQTCIAEPRQFTLACPLPNCPIVDINVIPGLCNPDGTRQVNFQGSITNNTANTVVAELEFEPGITSSAFVAQPNAVGPINETYSYATNGVHTAWLIIVTPENCPDVEITVGPLVPCPIICAEVIDLEPQFSGCAGKDQTVTVGFTGSVSPPDADVSNCTFKWDFGDLSAEIVTSGPQATHTYVDPGIYGVAVTLTCGDCQETTTTTVEIRACCPIVGSISASVAGCAGDGQSTTITADAQPGDPGIYRWSRDGQFVGATSGPASPPMEINEPGNHQISVEYIPAQAGCSSSFADTTSNVARCDDQPPRGSSCGSLIWAAVIALFIGIILLAIGGCLPPPYDGYLAVIGYALVTVYALLILLWLALGWFNKCDIDICEAAAIHMAVLGPLLAVLAVLSVWILCINRYFGVTILATIVGIWAPIAAGCWLKRLTR